MFHYYTPLKHYKVSGFLTFSRSIEIEYAPDARFHNYCYCCPQLPSLAIALQNASPYVSLLGTHPLSYCHQHKEPRKYKTF